MIKQKRLRLLAVLLLCIAKASPQKVTTTSTQTKADDPPSWGIKFSGFLRNDLFFDSRQVTSARPAVQGDLLLYPANVNLDANGNDINAASSLSILSITSRLTGTITAPNAFGAKTSGIIEGEFFGNANGNENVFRLRHAYAKLDWAKTQLGFGQYWHPLFVTDCFPGVLGFNTGIPFQPFARNPQIRLTQKLGKNVNLIMAAISQTEAFVSSGSSTGVALGASSAAATYLNDAVVPNLHAQLQFKSGTFLAGAAIDYKQLRPALSTLSTTGATTTVATNEKVSSTTFELYSKITSKSFIAKAEYVYGENLYDQLMIGGYLAYGTTPNITYKPIRVSAYWLELMGTGKKVIPGLFFGYTQNNGAADAGAVASYTRAVTAGKTSIKSILRISPRLELVSGKFKFGTEVEVTNAKYGISDSDAKITGNTNSVTNTRILFVTTLSF